jgi:plasmid stabilization system protein ParE
LELGFGLLARQPSIGVRYDSLLPGLHRLGIDKHVVLYRIAAAGIRVVGILHQRMQPLKSRCEALGWAAAYFCPQSPQLAQFCG